jgi:pantetheine-phosphate adenylyltransferase
MPRYARAVLGGTFDRLHVGHEALLRTAFRLGRTVAIGVTTERYLAAHPKPDRGRIAPYSARRRALVRWLRAEFPGRSYSLHRLEDRFGGSVRSNVSVLVVSAETSDGGQEVNAERRRRGLRTVPVVTVPLVLADDLLPVSSRRVRAGEIDRHGRRIAPLHVEVVATDRAAFRWAVPAVREVFPGSRVTSTLARPARRPAPRGPAGGLRVELRRVPKGGWTALERSPSVSLRPRRLAGASPRELGSALERVLRPQRAAPAATV